MSIETKSNRGDIEFGIKCEGNSNKTTISLIEAYDKTWNIGGYTKEAKGIKFLVEEFDSYIIKPLEDRQNAMIVPF